MAHDKVILAPSVLRIFAKIVINYFFKNKRLICKHCKIYKIYKCNIVKTHCKFCTITLFTITLFTFSDYIFYIIYSYFLDFYNGIVTFFTLFTLFTIFNYIIYIIYNFTIMQIHYLHLTVSLGTTTLKSSFWDFLVFKVYFFSVRICWKCHSRALSVFYIVKQSRILKKLEIKRLKGQKSENLDLIISIIAQA
jgi:hypothetical protein